MRIPLEPPGHVMSCHLRKDHEAPFARVADSQAECHELLLRHRTRTLADSPADSDMHRITAHGHGLGQPSARPPSPWLNRTTATEVLPSGKVDPHGNLRRFGVPDDQVLLPGPALRDQKRVVPGPEPGRRKGSRQQDQERDRPSSGELRHGGCLLDTGKGERQHASAAWPGSRSYQHRRAAVPVASGDRLRLPAASPGPGRSALRAGLGSGDPGFSRFRLSVSCCALGRVFGHPDDRFRLRSGPGLREPLILRNRQDPSAFPEGNPPPARAPSSRRDGTGMPPGEEVGRQQEGLAAAGQRRAGDRHPRDESGRQEGPHIARVTGLSRPTVYRVLRQCLCAGG